MRRAVGAHRSLRTRVVVLCTRPPSAIGGVEQVVRAVTPAIAARFSDLELTVLAAFSRPTVLDRIPLLRDVVAGVLLVRRATKLTPDVLVLHSPFFAVACRIFTKQRFATIVVWHGVSPIAARHSRPRHVLLKLYASMASVLDRIALRADAHIVVDARVGDDLRAEYGFTGRISVARNGIDPELAAALQRIAPSVKDGRFRVLWIGQVAYRKGLDVAVQACELARRTVPWLELVVVGIGRTQLPAWATQTGPVQPSELPRVFADVDVLLFPSRYESFGLVTLEAMAAGLPVIASQAAAGSLVTEGRNGYVVPSFDPQLYANHLVALARDLDLRVRIGEVNRADVAAWSWSASADVWGRVIREVMTTRRSFDR